MSKWNTQMKGIGGRQYCAYCGKDAEVDYDMDDGEIYGQSYYCTCDKGKLEIKYDEHDLNIQDMKNLSKEEAKELAKKYWNN